MNVSFESLTPEARRQLLALMDRCEKQEPAWFDGIGVDEVAYCEELLKRNSLRCCSDRLCTIDGPVEDAAMKALIAGELRPYVRRYLNKTVERILATLKLLCPPAVPLPDPEKLHFTNGTLHLTDGFTTEQEWTMNRLPLDYDPEAPAPEHWLRFTGELLEPEDIATLQEYLGYCLIPTTRGQAMLLLIGRGGEGKSRISAVLQQLLGSNMTTGSIGRLESDKFSPANLENKLLFIDDDIKLEALPSTNTIKTIVTCDGLMELERKRMQPYQGAMYARLLCFGNGTLRSLHDRSNGFYRRQIILQTKTRPADRVDDPFLKEKLLEELPGILNWCLEGLLRLRKNNYRFTVSTRSRDLKEKTIEADNNMKAFLESEGYIAFETGARCTTEALYSTYAGWCADNAEKPLATITFSQYLNENAEELGIERRNTVLNKNGKRVRGYEGIHILHSSFPDFTYLPDDEPDSGNPFL